MVNTHISTQLGLNVSGHADIDFVDIKINGDTELFIDPCLIQTHYDEFSIQCHQIVQDYFSHLYKVYKNSDHGLEIFMHLGHLGERNEARLGYGTGRNGKAKTAKGMHDTLRGLHDLIINGIPMENAIDIPLMMPRFAEDCTSDMLVNILYKQLSEFTIHQCSKMGVQISPIKKKRHFWDHERHCWAVYEGNCLMVNDDVILLVPKNFVCKSFYYSTSQFFMSQIASMIQKERTQFINGKEILPRKVDIRSNELKEYGSLLNATRVHAQRNPALLEHYHLNLTAKYSERAMTDEELDCEVYGTSTRISA